MPSTRQWIQASRYNHNKNDEKVPKSTLVSQGRLPVMEITRFLSLLCPEFLLLLFACLFCRTLAVNSVFRLFVKWAFNTVLRHVNGQKNQGQMHWRNYNKLLPPPPPPSYMQTCRLSTHKHSRPLHPPTPQKVLQTKNIPDVPFLDRKRPTSRWRTKKPRHSHFKSIVCPIHACRLHSKSYRVEKRECFVSAVSPLSFADEKIVLSTGWANYWWWQQVTRCVCSLHRV